MVKIFWRKLSQGSRNGYFTKIEKQKCSPNSGCILIPRINKPTPSESERLIVFWDQKGVLLLEFMEHGMTITAASYNVTLQHLQWVIQNKRRGMLPSGIVLLHDNAWVQIVAATKGLLQRYRWEVFDHPPYSQQRLHSLWFSSLPSHETMDRTEFWHRQWVTDKCSKLVESTDSYLLWQQNWKVNTTLRKMSTLEWLCSW